MKIDLLTAFEDTLQTDEKKADDKTYGNQPGKVAGSADHGYAVENHRKKLDVPQGDDGEIHKFSGTWYSGAVLWLREFYSPVLVAATVDPVAATVIL